MNFANLKAIDYIRRKPGKNLPPMRQLEFEEKLTWAIGHSQKQPGAACNDRWPAIVVDCSVERDIIG
jgi:hypothetical protein